MRCPLFDPRRRYCGDRCKLAWRGAYKGRCGQKGKRLTVAFRAAIAEAYEAGTPVPVICATFGIWPGGVYRLLGRRRGHKRKTTGEQRVAILEAYERGERVTAICETWDLNWKQLADIVGHTDRFAERSRRIFRTGH